jgi:hypothetical protein
LTSLRATRVMGTSKNQETRCTIFHGGFDAGA